MKDRVDHLPENYGKSQWTDNRLLIFASYKNKLFRKYFLIKKASRKLYLIQLNKKKTIILKFNRDNNWFMNYYNYILFLNALNSIF